MGEKVEGAKNEGEKKPAAAQGSNTVVYKTDMHCEGCAKKIKRAVRNFPGVEQVKTDAAANKLTVTGKLDPTALKAKLEEKIKKKVELVSAPPAGKKDSGGDKKAEEKNEKPAEKKAEEKKPAAAEKPKEKEAAAPKENVVPLKIRLHCEGCIQKMRSKILKFKGVNTVSFDMAKDLVTVAGTMDTKALFPFLSEKFKRPVEVITPAKKDDKKPAAAEGGEKKKDGAGDKKEEKKEGKKEAASEGGEKKEEKKEVAAVPAGGGTVVNKMEYSGYPYAAASTSYWYDPGHVYNHNKFVMEAQEHQAYVNQGYGGHQYAMPMEHYPAPQMVSDENPNGCTVM